MAENVNRIHWHGNVFAIFFMNKKKQTKKKQNKIHWQLGLPFLFAEQRSSHEVNPGSISSIPPHSFIPEVPIDTKIESAFRRNFFHFPERSKHFLFHFDVFKVIGFSGREVELFLLQIDKLISFTGISEKCGRLCASFPRLPNQLSPFQ